MTVQRLFVFKCIFDISMIYTSDEGHSKSRKKIKNVLWPLPEKQQSSFCFVFFVVRYFVT